MYTMSTAWQERQVIHALQHHHVHTRHRPAGWRSVVWYYLDVMAESNLTIDLAVPSAGDYDLYLCAQGDWSKLISRSDKFGHGEDEREVGSPPAAQPADNPSILPSVQTATLEKW